MTENANATEDAETDAVYAVYAAVLEVAGEDAAAAEDVTGIGSANAAAAAADSEKKKKLKLNARKKLKEDAAAFKPSEKLNSI